MRAQRLFGMALGIVDAFYHSGFQGLLSTGQFFYALPGDVLGLREALQGAGLASTIGAWFYKPMYRLIGALRFVKRDGAASYSSAASRHSTLLSTQWRLIT